MGEKKSFIVYFDKRSMIEALINNDDANESYERVGRLFLALCDYAERGETDIKMDGMTTVAYLSFLPQLQSDKDKYAATVNRNRKNGKLGGRPKKHNDKNPKNPNGYFENPKKPILYQLRSYERKGKALMDAGMTREVLETLYKAEGDE